MKKFYKDEKNTLKGILSASELKDLTVDIVREKIEEAINDELLDLHITNVPGNRNADYEEELQRLLEKIDEVDDDTLYELARSL